MRFFQFITVQIAFVSAQGPWTANDPLKVLANIVETAQGWNDHADAIYQLLGGMSSGGAAIAPDRNNHADAKYQLPGGMISGMGSIGGGAAQLAAPNRIYSIVSDWFTRSNRTEESCEDIIRKIRSEIDGEEVSPQLAKKLNKLMDKLEEHLKLPLKLLDSLNPKLPDLMNLDEIGRQIKQRSETIKQLEAKIAKAKDVPAKKEAEALLKEMKESLAKIIQEAKNLPQEAAAHRRLQAQPGSVSNLVMHRAEDRYTGDNTEFAEDEVQSLETTELDLEAVAEDNIATLSEEEANDAIAFLVDFMADIFDGFKRKFDHIMGRSPYTLNGAFKEFSEPTEPSYSTDAESETTHLIRLLEESTGGEKNNEESSRKKFGQHIRDTLNHIGNKIRDGFSHAGQKVRDALTREENQSREELKVIADEKEAAEHRTEEGDAEHRTEEALESATRPRLNVLQGEHLVSTELEATEESFTTIGESAKFVNSVTELFEDELTTDFEESSHETEEMTHELGELTHETGEVTHETEAVTHETEAVTHKTEAVTHKTEAVTHKPGEVTHKTEAVTHKTEAVTHKPGEVTHKNEEVTHESEAVTHESEAVTHESEELRSINGVDENGWAAPSGYF